MHAYAACNRDVSFSVQRFLSNTSTSVLVFFPVFQGFLAWVVKPPTDIHWLCSGTLWCLMIQGGHGITRPIHRDRTKLLRAIQKFQHHMNAARSLRRFTLDCLEEAAVVTVTSPAGFAGCRFAISDFWGFCYPCFFVTRSETNTEWANFRQPECSA